jgi:hypothetical protein
VLPASSDRSEAGGDPIPDPATRNQSTAGERRLTERFPDGSSAPGPPRVGSSRARSGARPCPCRAASLECCNPTGALTVFLLGSSTNAHGASRKARRLWETRHRYCIKFSTNTRVSFIPGGLPVVRGEGEPFVAVGKTRTEACGFRNQQRSSTVAPTDQNVRASSSHDGISDEKLSSLAREPNKSVDTFHSRNARLVEVNDTASSPRKRR